MKDGPDEGATLRWGQTRRLEFIEFRLLWDRRINRKELIDFFGISTQQASLDFSRYVQAAPKGIAYDRSEKTYKPTKSFRPAFLSPSTRLYLSQVLGVASGAVRMGDTFLSHLPPCGIIQAPQRHIDSKVLFRVLSAIRDKSDILANYYSMRRGRAEPQWIRPHAIAFDGLRWHARAWSHDRAVFRDFVLSRFKTVTDARPSSVDTELDYRWTTIALLILCPNRELSLAQKAAICTEFDMRRGELRIRMREALVFHFARLMRLLPGDKSSTFVQPLEWKNQKQFLGVIREARDPLIRSSK